MKRIIITLMLAIAFTIIATPHTQAQTKEIPTYHEFTVKFTQKVDAYQLQKNKNVSLKCNQTSIPFAITQDTPKKVKIISEDPLPENSTCTLQVDPFTKKYRR